MKKIIFISSLSLLFLASCKKDYHCTCSGPTPTGYSVKGRTIRGTEKAVTKECDAGDIGNPNDTYYTNCYIK